MTLHEQPGDNMSFISPENSFIQSQNVSHRRPVENEHSRRESPRISDRNRVNMWPPTPQQPQIIMDDKQLRQDNAMAIDQQFLYEQLLIHEQLQESHR